MTRRHDNSNTTYTTVDRYQYSFRLRTMACSSTSPRRYRRRTVVPQGGAHRQERRNTNDQGQEAPATAAPQSLVTRLDPLRLPVYLDRVWIIQTATSILVDHLLYARGLFPMPVTELLSLPVSLEDGSNGQPPTLSGVSPSTRRKLRQARNQLQQFFDAWTSDASSNLIRLASYVLINVGASVASSRDSFLLDVRGLSNHHHQQQQQQHIEEGNKRGPQSPAALARRLLPRVVEGDSSVDLLPFNAASSRLFVSVWVRNEELKKYWNDRSAKDSDVLTASTRYNFQWTTRTGRVLPKPEELQPMNNASRKPKKRLATMPLSYQTSDASLCDDELVIATRNGLEASQGQWLSFPQSIKGFRM